MTSNNVQFGCRDGIIIVDLGDLDVFGRKNSELASGL